MALLMNGQQLAAKIDGFLRRKEEKYTELQYPVDKLYQHISSSSVSSQRDYIEEPLDEKRYRGFRAPKSLRINPLFQ